MDSHQRHQTITSSAIYQTSDAEKCLYIYTDTVSNTSISNPLLITLAGGTLPPAAAIKMWDFKDFIGLFSGLFQDPHNFATFEGPGKIKRQISGLFSSHWQSCVAASLRCGWIFKLQLYWRVSKVKRISKSDEHFATLWARM